MVLVQLDPSTELGDPWPASQGLLSPLRVEQKEEGLGGVCACPRECVSQASREGGAEVKEPQGKKREEEHGKRLCCQTPLCSSGTSQEL